jgi:hypothetical protein
MPNDQFTTAASAIAFISKCEIKGVRFTVDGETVKSDMRKGAHIRDFSDGAASLYHNKRVDNWDGARLVVRANGIYMFGLYIPSGVQGMLIVELNRPSVELLTANRDGFRDRNLRYAISEFGNQLAADTRSAIKQKAGLVRERYKGNGKYSSGLDQSDGTAAMLDLQGVMMPAAGKKKITIATSRSRRCKTRSSSSWCPGGRVPDLPLWTCLRSLMSQPFPSRGSRSVAARTWKTRCGR